MDTCSIGRNPAIAAPIAPQRAEMPGAVATELAPEATVQPVGATQAVQFEPSGSAQMRAALDAKLRDMMVQSRTVMDPDMREVILQKVDPRTGEVIHQIPDEMMMRLRAYIHDLIEAQEEAKAAGSHQVEKIA